MERVMQRNQEDDEVRQVEEEWLAGIGSGQGEDAGPRTVTSEPSRQGLEQLFSASAHSPPQVSEALPPQETEKSFFK